MKILMNNKLTIIAIIPYQINDNINIWSTLNIPKSFLNTTNDYSNLFLINGNTL